MNDYMKEQDNMWAFYRNLREYKGLLVDSCHLFTGGGGYEGIKMTFEGRSCHHPVFRTVKIVMVNCKSPTIELTAEKFNEHFSGWQEMDQCAVCMIAYNLWESTPIPENGTSFYKFIK